MKIVLAALLLLPTLAMAEVSECPIRNGEIEGLVTISQAVEGTSSTLVVDGEDVPALRAKCFPKVGGLLCAHQDAAGARYDVFVGRGVNRRDNKDLGIRVGVVKWAGDKNTAFEVRKECDPFSKWE